MNDGTEGRHGWRIIIVGTGGQGVLTAARLLCKAFAEQGHEVVSGQLHGMAQRGGSVLSSVVMDAGISPVIPAGRADTVLGFEPVETARALPFMSAQTVVYMNTTPVIPYVVGQRAVLEDKQAKYPDVSGLQDAIRAVTPHMLAFDATPMTVEAGSGQSLNMVMLGCLIGAGTWPCTPDRFWQTACRDKPAAWKEANTRAFYGGVALAERVSRKHETDRNRARQEAVASRRGRFAP